MAPIRSFPTDCSLRRSLGDSYTGVSTGGVRTRRTREGVIRTKMSLHHGGRGEDSFFFDPTFCSVTLPKDGTYGCPLPTHNYLGSRQYCPYSGRPRAGTNWSPVNRPRSDDPLTSLYVCVGPQEGRLRQKQQEPGDTRS